MKLIINKLDNGYTLSVTIPAVPANGDEAGIPEIKRRLVFETAQGLTRELVGLGVVPQLDLRDLG